MVLACAHPARSSLRDCLIVLKRAHTTALASGAPVYSPPPDLSRFRGRASHAFARRDDTPARGAPAPGVTLVEREVGKVALHMRIEAGTGDYELVRNQHGVNSPEPIRSAVVGLRAALTTLLELVTDETELGRAPGEEIDEDRVIYVLAGILVHDYTNAYEIAAAPPPPPRRGPRCFTVLAALVAGAVAASAIALAAADPLPLAIARPPPPVAVAVDARALVLDAGAPSFSLQTLGSFCCCLALLALVARCCGQAKLLRGAAARSPPETRSHSQSIDLPQLVRSAAARRASHAAAAASPSLIPSLGWVLLLQLLRVVPSRAARGLLFSTLGMPALHASSLPSASWRDVATSATSAVSRGGVWAMWALALVVQLASLVTALLSSPADMPFTQLFVAIVLTAAVARDVRASHRSTWGHAINVDVNKWTRASPTSAASPLTSRATRRRSSGSTKRGPSAFLNAKAKSLTPSSPSSPRSIAAVMDSGCTFHCHPRREDLINFKPCSECMTGIAGNKCMITGIGDLPIRSRDRAGKWHDFLIRNVRLAPQFTDTLLSVDQFFEDSKTEVRFANVRAVCVPADSSGSALELPFTRRDGLFVWDVVCTARAAAAAAAATEGARALASGLHRPKSTHFISALPADEAAMLMHRRLHCGSATVRSLHRMCDDAPSNLSKVGDVPCEHCAEANCSRHPHSLHSYKPSHVGRLIHADIVGPFVRSHRGGFKYLLVLVDDHSRFKMAYPMATKGQAVTYVKQFVASLNALCSRGKSEPVKVVGSLHTDNAGEFLSREFSEFLDEQLIEQSACPPHVHSLNGVAERAIRSIMEVVRSNLIASKCPVSFWPYLVDHALDVLNRTTGPPNQEASSYELVTGEKPRIMSIMPFGCRAYAVKPRSAYSKTEIEPRAWAGQNLGRDPMRPGAFRVWLSTGSVLSVSDVYFDETLMPWRPAGEQRLSGAVPSACPDLDQNLRASPDVEPAEPPSEEPESMPGAYHHATGSPSSTSSRSRSVLVLFSGPYNRPDGLGAFLTQIGLTPVLIDNMPCDGGGPDHDITNDEFYARLQQRVVSGEFFAVIAAPPCSTFSVSRFFEAKSAKGGGPPPVRVRSHVLGRPDVDPKHARELSVANQVVERTCVLLDLARQAGAEFLVENPADRGDGRQSDLFITAEHAPIWLMPSVQSLAGRASTRLVTFPMCAFGAPWQKYTSIMYTPGLEHWMAPLAKLACTHSTHGRIAGGDVDARGKWNSAEAASYPPSFSYYLARCVASLLLTTKASDVAPADRPRLRTVQSADDDELHVGRPSPPTPREPPPPAAQPPSSPPSPLVDDFDAATAAANDVPLPAEGTAEPAAQPRRRRRRQDEMPRFERGLGRPGTRSAGSALFSCLLSIGPACIGRTCIASAAGEPDPKNRQQALRQDGPGWKLSERAEIDNHESAESWRVIPRSQVPRGRHTVKLVWAYKNKRSGKRKSRLCVQGCAQTAGVDYDQTHSAAMRSGTLRLLASLSARHGLKMHRWDFVAAYLQGELLEGEVVYCTPPTGYYFDESGKLQEGRDDGERVCVVQKPIYGMAQAGRRWQRCLYPWLTEDVGMRQLFADSCVFEMKRTMPTPDGPRDERLIVGCYVDDLCCCASHTDEHSLYQDFINQLQSRWEVEDEGELTDLLNVEFTFGDDYVKLSQTAYIEKMVSTYLPDGIPLSGKQCSLPCDDSLPRHTVDALTQEAADVDAGLLKQYQSIVGALLYCATQTRPDVAFAVGYLCRAMGKPTPAMLSEATRVLCYLHRTRHLGLRFTADQRDLEGFSDSDWGVKHSTTGYVFRFNSAAISWASKKQASVALSSCEAEIMAASEAAKEAVFLSAYLDELGERDPSVPVKLAVDNTGARDLAYNPEHHAKTKHIERRHFFVREMVEEMRLRVPYVNTVDNLADFFTKPLPPKQFALMRDEIMNVPFAERTQP